MERLWGGEQIDGGGVLEADAHLVADEVGKAGKDEDVVVRGEIRQVMIPGNDGKHFRHFDLSQQQIPLLGVEEIHGAEDEGFGDGFDLVLPFFFVDDFEDQQFADVVEETGGKRLVLHDPKIETVGEHAGGKGASHGMLPQLFHDAVELPVAGAERFAAQLGQDDPEHFRHAQPDQGGLDRGGGDKPPVQGRIGYLEQVAGERLIGADQFFDGAQVRLFLDQLLLNPQRNGIEYRQGKSL